MDISPIEFAVSTLTAPILILVIKEYSDYFKRKEELKNSIIKLVLDRKLRLAEEAINVWKGQEVVLSMISELCDRAHENIELFGGKDFQNIFQKYCNDLDLIGKKSWEVTNAVELYFDIKVTDLGYNPYKVMSEWVAEIQNIALLLKEDNDLMNTTTDVNTMSELDLKMERSIETLRLALGRISPVLRDGIAQLGESVSLVKKEVNSQYTFKT